MKLTISSDQKHISVKKIYFVVVLSYGDKMRRAHIEETTNMQNLKTFFLERLDINRVLIIHLANNLAHAEDLVENWNNSYHEQGILYEF